MFARKLMHLMAALAVGLVGFGVVLADDGPVKPMPIPFQPPVALPQPVLTDKDRADNTARLKAQGKGLAGMAAKGEPIILVEALCFEAPAGFYEESGLEGGSSILSPLETRMFNALIRAAKEKGTLEVIARPQLKVRDNQTMFAQVGQNFPYLGAPEAKGKDGKTVQEAKIMYQEVGLILKVAPTISTDGKSISLRIDATNSDVSPTPVSLGNGITAPAFNIQTQSVAVLLGDAGSVVFGASYKFKTDDQKVRERIWLLTTHIVKGDGKPMPPAKHPLPVPPPTPVHPPLAVPATGLEPVKPVTPMVPPNPPRP